jgi:hypothetical protein
MFPLMAQSVNDSKEAKEEMRKERMEQYQMMQNKMWKQQDHNRKAEIDKMIMKMKMHDRKMYQEHMKKHHNQNFYHNKWNKNHKPQMHSDKKRRIIGGIVIFSLGYIVGANDDHRGKKHHKKEKDFRGDR